MTEFPDFLHLSEAEARVLSDREFMPIKHQVSEKVDAALLHLRDLLLPVVQAGPWPAAVRVTPPKLSRGENYRHYAYRLLDCPRVFAGDDMLAFRSLVLWGHPIGFHLMLAGRYRELYLPRFLQRYPELPPGAWLSVQADPWRWEAEAEGLLPLAGLSPAELRRETGRCAFLKVSYFLPLAEFAQMPVQGLAYWQAWQTLLAQ
ncbi:MAG: hypothetical protein D6722_17300 [Bacteroidetes bacterium]|nr:MAG: hypothetical protein D6722_17300 [Bacteroidota bacterium]